MDSRPEPQNARQRSVTRRQMIAGTGVAAAAWVAPSVVHLDVASAQGSSSSIVTVTPGSIPAGVSVMPLVMNTIAGESVFGRFGNNSSDNGPVFTVVSNGAPPHTQVNVTVRVCYRSSWEGPGSQQRFQDSIEILVDGVTAPGFPVTMAIADACMDFSFTIPHSSATLSLDVVGTVTAQAEDFGVASIVLEYF